MNWETIVLRLQLQIWKTGSSCEHMTRTFIFVFIYFYCMWYANERRGECVGVCMIWHTCRGQSTNSRNLFSPFSMEFGDCIQVMRLVWQMFLSTEPSHWLLFSMVWKYANHFFSITLSTEWGHLLLWEISGRMCGYKQWKCGATGDNLKLTIQNR